MKPTRKEEDSYTSIKVPDSLRRQLRILAAERDKYIYQIIAEMVLKEIEAIRSKEDEK